MEASTPVANGSLSVSESVSGETQVSVTRASDPREELARPVSGSDVQDPDPDLLSPLLGPIRPPRRYGALRRKRSGSLEETLPSENPADFTEPIDWYAAEEWIQKGPKGPGQVVQVKKELNNGLHHAHNVVFMGFTAGVPSFLELFCDETTFASAGAQVMHSADLESVIGDCHFRVTQQNLFPKFEALPEKKAAAGVATIEWLCAGRRDRKQEKLCGCLEFMDDVQELWLRYLFATFGHHPGDLLHICRKNVPNAHQHFGVYLGFAEGKDMVLHAVSHIVEDECYAGRFSGSPSSDVTAPRVALTTYEELSANHRVSCADRRLVPSEDTPRRFASTMEHLLQLARTWNNQTVEHAAPIEKVCRFYFDMFVKLSGYSQIRKSSERRNAVGKRDHHRSSPQVDMVVMKAAGTAGVAAVGLGGIFGAAATIHPHRHHHQTSSKESSPQDHDRSLQQNLVQDHAESIEGIGEANENDDEDWEETILEDAGSIGAEVYEFEQDAGDDLVFDSELAGDGLSWDDCIPAEAPDIVGGIVDSITSMFA